MFACTKFRSFICPYYPLCTRGDLCLFSHEAPKAAAGKTSQVKAQASRRPSSNVRVQQTSSLKRPTPPITNAEPPAKRPAPEPLRKEPSPLLAPVSISQQIATPQSSGPLAAALSARGFMNKDGVIVQANPPLDSAVNIPSGPSLNSGSFDGSSSAATSDDFSARVAAYVSQAESIPTTGPANLRSKVPPKQKMPVIAGQPPQVKADLRYAIPLKTRQNMVNKFFEQFSRIYAPVLEKRQTLAHEHAMRQERQLVAKALPKTYLTLAIPIYNRLKKRPVATSIKDIGIDGEWKPPVSGQTDLEIPMEQIETLITPINQLQLMEYPFPPESETDEFPGEEEDKEEDGVKKEKAEICDRCNVQFVPRWPLDEDAMVACKHHWGYTRTVTESGIKDRLYSCCREKIGAIGCTLGPHVFKEEDSRKLEKRIPFIWLPEDSSNAEKIVSIDCEMSFTTGGMELTRLTIINYAGVPILDELVQTKYPVLDLNTRWSGIKSLEDAKYDLTTVRIEMGKLVGRNTVIVGHGLENDLKALRLYHTRIIDTAALFPHPRGLPIRHSLRILTQKLLGRFIQQGTQGHDSVEDAKACLELIRLRVQKGDAVYLL